MYADFEFYREMRKIDGTTYSLYRHKTDHTLFAVDLKDGFNNWTDRLQYQMNNGLLSK